MENLPVEQDHDEIIIKCDLEEMSKAFFKDYEIIWHDPSVNSQENQQYLAQLEKLCKVQTFTKWKEAEDYIKVAKAVCHVITSGTNGELFVKEIFSSANVPKIFTFCRSEGYHSAWTKNYEKVLCTETKIESVILKIQENLLDWQKQTSSLKFDLPVFAPIFDDHDKSQMNYLHLYLKVIPSFTDRMKAKNDFVDLSKRLYMGQRRSEKLITEFEDTYTDYKMEAILKWYTKPSFLFKVINNCLRIATSDSIQWSRFLLKDIERAIKDQYQAKSKGFSGLLYRAAYLSEKEWSSLKDNVNREIEMHGFLSVSKEDKIAWKFMSENSTQKVFITILVPKGPNEEEQGFAEMEEFSDVPKEQEILFNVRSRFTVLEAEDEYSIDKPHRHLVLLYGARSLRKSVAEKNPVLEIPIKDIGNISCAHCKVPVAEKMFFMSLRDFEKQIYSCKNCLDDAAAPFICVPVTESKSTIKIKGWLLANYSQQQIPFYGYKCSKCGAKNQKRCFVCLDCSEKGCQNCFEKRQDCIEAGHSVILETFPFSFWSEKMSEKELNHLNFQNNLLRKGKLEFKQAKMYIEAHEFEKAIKYCKLILQQNEAKGKEVRLANAYHFLGIAYGKQGEYGEALQSHSKSLDIRKRVHGDHHPDVSNSYNNIGSVYTGLGDYKKALECHFKSLETDKLIYGEKHRDVSACYNNIGLAYHKKAEYQKAIEYYQKSREIDQSIYGEKHPDVASTYMNIGVIEEERGNLAKALDSYFKSLEIDKTIHGERHPDVATIYASIGLVYSKIAEYQKALEYFLKSLEIQKSVHRENHPDIASSYNNIALIYMDQGDYEKALEYHFKSLEINKFVFGEKHPQTAITETNIGSIYKYQGKIDKALEYYLKSLNVYKSVYGDKHPETAICENNLGSVYRDKGEYEKALECHFKSLETNRSLYGEKHQETAICYNNIGLVHQAREEYYEALGNFLEALDIHRSVYKDKHPEVAIFYDNVGSVYEKLGEQENANVYYQKSREIKKFFMTSRHCRF